MEGYVIRHLDDLGRIVIPKDVRNVVGLEPGDEVEIYPVGGELLLRKHNTDFVTEHSVTCFAMPCGEFTNAVLAAVPAFYKAVKVHCVDGRVFCSYEYNGEVVPVTDESLYEMMRQFFCIDEIDKITSDGTTVWIVCK